MLGELVMGLNLIKGELGYVLRRASNSEGG